MQESSTSASLAQRLADKSWSLTSSWPRPELTGRVLDAELLLFGLSVDAHLQAVETELRLRKVTAALVAVDREFAFPGGVSFDPSAGCDRFDAVYCRWADLRRPVPHHGRRVFVDIERPPDEAWHAHDLDEMEAAARCWIATVDSPSWIDDPWATARADTKAAQLRAAVEARLRVPRTLVTNDSAKVAQFIAECGGQVVHKAMSHSMVRHSSGVGFLHTTPISAKGWPTLGPLRQHALFQEVIPVEDELRVVVLGERLFAARIITESPRIDWRHGIASGGTRFEACQLDGTTASAVLHVVRRLGLRYAAADLLRTPGGEIVFLELNPTGSYLWLAHAVGWNLTGALVDELLSGK